MNEQHIKLTTYDALMIEGPDGSMIRILSDDYHGGFIIKGIRDAKGNITRHLALFPSAADNITVVNRGEP